MDNKIKLSMNQNLVVTDLFIDYDAKGTERKGFQLKIIGKNEYIEFYEDGTWYYFELDSE